MKKEKTNEEILEEMIKGIKEAEEEEDRQGNLIETLWDDMELLSDMSEMLSRLSLYLRTYEMKLVKKLKETSYEKSSMN